MPRWFVAVPLVLVVLGLLAAAATPRAGAVDRALTVVRDDRRFATATEAGAAYTRISTLLQEGGESCERKGSGGCDHLFTGAAHARVSAVSLLSCTRRGVVVSRAAMTSYLEELRRTPAATLPPLPACAP